MKFISFVFLFLLSGCGQSALDKCTDSKSYLWNDNAKGNEYKGNERYWDAIKECENKHG